MIHKLLNPDPKERLHILEAIRHRWITMDERDPLVLVPCPNYLREEDLDDRILDHVEEQLKLNSDDIIRDVIQNKYVGWINLLQIFVEIYLCKDMMVNDKSDNSETQL